MPFFQIVAFRAELTKPAIMDFIARTPADSYFLAIASNGTEVYGLVLNEDVLEYLTNEFRVIELNIVTALDARTASSKPGCKKTGNIDLLDL